MKKWFLLFVVLLMVGGYYGTKSNAAVHSSNPLNVPLVNQMSSPMIYNGCEITSLTMIMNYNGIHVSKMDLEKKVAKVPLRYANGLKGNPNVGFVGDMIHGPGLAVYHGPIVSLAKHYAGNRVVDLTGQSISSVYHQIDQGEPVWVITTTSFSPVYNFQTWHTPQGTIYVTFSEHSVVVTGYDKQYVYINNPYGYKNERINRKNFEASWIQMGRQAVSIEKK